MRKKNVSDQVLLLRKSVKRGDEKLIHYSDYPLKELGKTEPICKWRNYTRIKVLWSLFELLEYKLKAFWEGWYLKLYYRELLKSCFDRSVYKSLTDQLKLCIFTGSMWEIRCMESAVSFKCYDNIFKEQIHLKEMHLSRHQIHETNRFLLTLSPTLSEDG